MIRAVWTASAPRSRRDPNCVVSARRCGSRRTAGFRRGSCKPGHPDLRVAAGPGCMLFSFQGSRTATTVAGRPHLISTFAAPARSGSPHAGASRASLRERLRLWEGEEVSQAIKCRRAGQSLPSGRGRIPPPPPRSSGRWADRDPGEAPFSRSEHAIVEPGGLEVELGQRLAVDAHPAAGDQPPGLAAGRHAQAVHEEGGQVDGAGRHRDLRHLRRGLPVAHHPVEVRLGGLPRPRAVEAVGDEAREAALVVGGVPGGRGLAGGQEPIPLGEAVS